MCSCLLPWPEIPGGMIACTPVPEDFAVRFIREQYCTGETVTGPGHGDQVDYLPGLYRAAGKKPGE